MTIWLICHISQIGIRVFALPHTRKYEADGGPASPPKISAFASFPRPATSTTSWPTSAESTSPRLPPASGSGTPSDFCRETFPRRFSTRSLRACPGRQQRCSHFLDVVPGTRLTQGYINPARGARRALFGAYCPRPHSASAEGIRSRTSLGYSSVSVTLSASTCVPAHSKSMAASDASAQPVPLRPGSIERALPRLRQPCRSRLAHRTASIPRTRSRASPPRVRRRKRVHPLPLHRL